MLQWLGIWAQNPFLLWGGLAVAAPIIIHLLARRKFRVVDWAAMEFLLDANRRNRRRIRLEHLLLLLLRCLAMLLIALLVARLFHHSTGLASLIGQTTRTERIVLLDDSPSMQLTSAGKTVFQRATTALGDFVRQASQEKPGDTFSLILTSRPDKPAVNGQYFEKAEEIIDTIDRLAPADVAADVPRSLLAVNDLIDAADQSGSGNVNRVVYVLSDMRGRDWAGDEQADAASGDSSLPVLLERLAARTDGVVVVNVGQEPEPNLSLADIEPAEKTIVKGVPTRFEVTVANHGPSDASDVTVTFIAGDTPPQTGYIERIRSGAAESVPFTFTFADAGSVAMSAQIAPDALPVDNDRHFAARVREGVKVLVVDGDPSSDLRRSETFLLSRALDPPGESASGNVVEVITENQFQSTDLSGYQVVFLANVYQITVPQRDALEAWVRDGGGLIVALGDQVDPDLFNEMLFRDGRGLSPAQLTQIQGDPTERQWVNLDLLQPNHPVLDASQETQMLIGRVKFFRYWAMTVPKQLIDDGQASIVGAFNDPETSPAIAERTFGSGRVILFATALDNDWNTWPEIPSYIVTALELVRYTAPAQAARGNLEVGQRLRHPLDISQYQAKAELRLPKQDQPITLQAVPDEPPSDAAPDATEPAAPAGPAQTAAMVFRYDDVNARGLYNLELTGYDGQTTPVLFAANIDPSEGDLTPANTTPLRRKLGEANVQFVDSTAYFDAGGEGGRAELWRGVLVALVIVLCTEQLLAFLFAKRR